MRRLPLRYLAFASALLIAPAVLLADSDGDAPTNMHELWRSWEFPPGIVSGLALSLVLYVAGTWKTWRAADVGHGILPSQVWYFAGGWITLAIALVSPLHPLGEILFSAHMVQHELLMLIAAPLLVLSHPMAAFLRAFPAPVSHELGRLSNTHLWKIIWGGISHPFVAWSLHAIVLWGWHAPYLFQATLHNEWVHAAQHISFILSSLLFWWAIIHGHRGATNYGTAVLYLFTTAIHSGLLGALLTFSRSQWYPDYDNTRVWGLTGLEDQQLGGLVMWVPACTVYILAGLAMFAKWLKQSERAALKRESVRLPQSQRSV
jgi:putative membrane protein